MLSNYLKLTFIAVTIAGACALADAVPVRVQPCPRSAWLIPKIDWFKDGIAASARDDIPVMFNEIVDGRVSAFATPETLESVIQFYTAEFRAQGFTEIQEYTGSSDHMRGRYRRGEDLAWVSAQVSGDRRLYRYLAAGQKIPAGYNFVLAVIGKDSKAPPPVAIEAKEEPVSLPFKAYPGSSEFKLKAPRFTDGQFLIRKGEGPSGYSFVNQGEAQAFTAAAPIKKIASHFEAEMAKQGFKPMQSKKVSPVHQLDVFSKGDTAVIIELFSESGDFVRFIAEGQNPVAKGAVGIIIAMGKKTFF